MTLPPLAHAGHWIVDTLYLVPLLIVVAMLAITSIRDRRAEAADAAAGGSGPAAGGSALAAGGSAAAAAPAPPLDADAPRDDPSAG
jgi:hypothetical protein